MSKAFLGFDILASPEFKKRLPPQTRRVIIDIAVDDAVKIFIESFADDQKFVLSLSQLIEDDRIATVDKAAEPTNA